MWFKVVCENILCTASADSTLNRWWHNISSWREYEGFSRTFWCLGRGKSEDKRPGPTSSLRVCNTLNPDCSIATSSSNSLQWSVPSLGAIARRRPPSSRGGYNGRSPNSYKFGMSYSLGVVLSWVTVLVQNFWTNLWQCRPIRPAVPPSVLTEFQVEFVGLSSWEGQVTICEISTLSALFLKSGSAALCSNRVSSWIFTGLFTPPLGLLGDIKVLSIGIRAWLSILSLTALRERCW